MRGSGPSPLGPGRTGDFCIVMIVRLILSRSAWQKDFAVWPIVPPPNLNTQCMLNAHSAPASVVGSELSTTCTCYMDIYAIARANICTMSEGALVLQ